MPLVLLLLLLFAFQILWSFTIYKSSLCIDTAEWYEARLACVYECILIVAIATFAHTHTHSHIPCETKTN